MLADLKNSVQKTFLDITIKQNRVFGSKKRNDYTNNFNIVLVDYFQCLFWSLSLF